jgi:hypothetical protein
MNRRFNYLPAWVLAGFLAVLSLCGRATIAAPPLTPDQILQRAVERAVSATTRESRPNYAYSRHTILEDLDTKGRIKDHKDKVFDVSVEGGLTFLKLIELNGQKLSAADLKKENEREAAERQKLMDGKPGKRGDERENFLTMDLVRRFHFALSGQQDLNGRQAYVLVFDPKPNLPVKTLTDRFVNQMAGTVWIDAEDFEIARAEVHLQGEVTLWGGIVGTLKHCRYTLERIRLGDGTWFNQTSHGIFEGRKLLEPMMIRTRSEASDFHRVPVTVD